MGGTLKADGIGKGSGQEGGHSKAGVVFLSQGPTLQEPGEGTREGGRKLATTVPPSPPWAVTRSQSAPWRRSRFRTSLAMNEKLRPCVSFCPAFPRRGSGSGK